MFFVDLILALLFAAIIALLFTAVFRARNPWTGFPLLFLILFLATWAGGVWMTPYGPTAGGAPFLPFLFVAVTVGLLLAAAAAPTRGLRSREAVREEEEAVAVAGVIGAFFWILVVFLAVAVLAGYLLL